MRELQAVIGREARAQFLDAEGRLPEVVVACVGGGSNAIGIFAGFVDDADVRLLGVEAAGAASLGTGKRGRPARRALIGSVGRGRPDRRRALDLGGPRLSGRRPGTRVAARLGPRGIRARERRRGARRVPRPHATEGIIPALEPAHALARARELEEEIVLVCLSGRGDKDLAEVLAQ